MNKYNSASKGGKRKYYNYFLFIILFVSLAVLPAKSFAQKNIPSIKDDTIPSKLDSIPSILEDDNIQEQLENMAETTQNEETDYTDILDALTRFREHPINLNHTNKEELASLQLLNDIQINNLLTHTEKTGKLITIYELQGIEGFDMQTIQKILPYVRVTDNFNTANFTIKEMFRSGQNMVMLRYGQILEKQTGFAPIDSAALYKSPNSRYIGTPQKLYARYRFTYGTNISWGITGEKDQGETFFKNDQRFNYPWYNQSLKGNLGTGFDFYSAHFYMHNIKFIKSLAIGDYQVTFGQGLTAWSSYAFGKSANIMAAKKSALGIHPYTSVDENKFLRGAAATVGFLKYFEATGFFSRKHVDANISDTLANGDIAAISALETTGYHTTPAEIADRHSLLQTIYGGNLSYKGRQLTVGLTAVKYQLDNDFNRSLSYYNQFEFSSKQNFNAGIDYNYIFHNFNFFGEEARSQNGGMAFLNGVLISLDDRLSLTVLHRNYQRNYQNLLSSGFAENTTAENEKGLYFGTIAKPSNTTTITAYYDRFEFPWLKYQVDAPSKGNDYVAQFNYTPNKKVDMYVRFRERDKEQNSASTDAVINYLIPLQENNYRFNISYSILPDVKLKNRVELIKYKLGDKKTENGYLIYQDVTYNKIGKPLSFTLRYALFQTDGYNSRIYSMESDVPGSYSIPAFYDRGSRFYIILDYMITRKIEFWLRYSQTFYDNTSVISPGALTEIQGNTKSEVRAEVRFKF